MRLGNRQRRQTTVTYTNLPAGVNVFMWRSATAMDVEYRDQNVNLKILPLGTDMVELSAFFIAYSGYRYRK